MYFLAHRLRTLLTRLSAARAALLDNLDATVSSRLSAASYTAPDNAGVAAIKAKTDNLPASPATEGTSTAIKAKTDLIPASPATEGTSTAIKAKTDNLPSNPAAVGSAMRLDTNGKADVVAAMQDAAFDDTRPAGSLAQYVYDVYQRVLGSTNYLDAAVSTRLAAASYTAPDNTGISNAASRSLDAKTASESNGTKLGTNADAAGTSTVFARLKQIVDSYLADGTNGLAAIRAYVDSIESSLADGTNGLAAIKGYVDSIETSLADGTNGLAAIKTAAAAALRRKQSDRTVNHSQASFTSGSGSYSGYTQFTASFGFDVEVYGAMVEFTSGGSTPQSVYVDLATGGAGSESVFATLFARVGPYWNGSSTYPGGSGFIPLHEARYVASGTRVAARVNANGDNVRVTIFYSKA